MEMNRSFSSPPPAHATQPIILQPDPGIPPSSGATDGAVAGASKSQEQGTVGSATEDYAPLDLSKTSSVVTRRSESPLDLSAKPKSPAAAASAGGPAFGTSIQQRFQQQQLLYSPHSVQYDQQQMQRPPVVLSPEYQHNITASASQGSGDLSQEIAALGALPTESSPADGGSSNNTTINNDEGDDDDDVIVLGVQKGRKSPIRGSPHHQQQFNTGGMRSPFGKAAFRGSGSGNFSLGSQHNVTAQSLGGRSNKMYSVNKRDMYTGGVAYSPFDLSSGLMRLKQMLMMAKDPQQAKQLALSFQKMALHALLKNRMNQQGGRGGAGGESPPAAMGTPPSGSSSAAGQSPVSSIGAAPHPPPVISVPDMSSEELAAAVLQGNTSSMISTTTAGIQSPVAAAVAQQVCLGSPPLTYGTAPIIAPTNNIGVDILKTGSNSANPYPSAFASTESLTSHSLNSSSSDNNIQQSQLNNTSTTTSTITPTSISTVTNLMTSLSTSVTTTTGTTMSTAVGNTDTSFSSRSPSNSNRSSPAVSTGSPAGAAGAGSSSGPSSGPGSTNRTSPIANFESEYMKYVRSKRFMSGGSDITAERIMYPLANQVKVDQQQVVPPISKTPPQSSDLINKYQQQQQLSEQQQTVLSSNTNTVTSTPTADKPVDRQQHNKRRMKPSYSEYQYIIAEINKITKNAIQMSEKLYRQRQAVAAQAQAAQTQQQQQAAVVVNANNLAPPPAHSKVQFNTVNPKKPHHSMMPLIQTAAASHIAPEQLLPPGYLKTSPQAGSFSSTSGGNILPTPQNLVDSSATSKSPASKNLSFGNESSSDANNSLRLQRYIEKQHQLYNNELRRGVLSQRAKIWTPPVMVGSLTADAANTKRELASHSASSHSRIRIPKFGKHALNDGQQELVQVVGMSGVDNKQKDEEKVIVHGSTSGSSLIGSQFNEQVQLHTSRVDGVDVKPVDESNQGYKYSLNSLTGGTVSIPTLIEGGTSSERPSVITDGTTFSKNINPPMPLSLNLDKHQAPPEVSRMNSNIVSNSNTTNSSDHYAPQTSVSSEMFRRYKHQQPFPCVSPNGSTVVKPVTSTFIGWNVSGYKRVPVANVNPIKVKGTDGYMDISPAVNNGGDNANHVNYRPQGFHPPSYAGFQGQLSEDSRNANSGNIHPSVSQQQQGGGIYPRDYYNGNHAAADGNKLSGDSFQSSVQDDRSVMLSSYGSPNSSLNLQPGDNNSFNQHMPGDAKAGNLNNGGQAHGIMGTPTTLKAQRRSSGKDDTENKPAKIRKKKHSKKDGTSADHSTSLTKKPKKDKPRLLLSKHSSNISLNKNEEPNSKSVESKAEAIKAILRDGIGSGSVSTTVSGSVMVMVPPDGDDGSRDAGDVVLQHLQQRAAAAAVMLAAEADDEGGAEADRAGGAEVVASTDLEAEEEPKKQVNNKQKTVGKGVCFSSDDEGAPVIDANEDSKPTNENGVLLLNAAGKVIKKRGRKRKLQTEPPRIKRKYVKKAHNFWATRTGSETKLTLTSDLTQLEAAGKGQLVKIKGKRGRKKKIKLGANRLRYREDSLYYNKNAKYEEELIREEERRLLLKAKRHARQSTTSNDDVTPPQSEAGAGGYPVPGESEASVGIFPVEEGIPLEDDLDQVLPMLENVPRAKFSMRGRGRKMLGGIKPLKIIKKRGRKRIHPLPIVISKQGVSAATGDAMYQDYPLDGSSSSGATAAMSAGRQRGLKKRRRRRWYKRRKQPLFYYPYSGEQYYGEEAENFLTTEGGEAAYDPLYEETVPEFALAEGEDPCDLIDLQVPYVDPALLAEVKGIVVCRETGESKLHRLTRMGHEDLAIRCIEAGLFDVNVRDHAGYSALHESCVTGRLKVAKGLLANGCDVNGSAMDGTKAIHDAVDHYRLELVRLLLSCGADPKTSTYSGKTPLKIARMPDMQKLLNGHIQDVTSPQVGERTQYWEFAVPGEEKTSEQQGMDIFDDVPSDHESDGEEMEFEFWEQEPIECYHMCVDPEDGPRNYYVLSDIASWKNISLDDFKILNFDLTYKTLLKEEALTSDTLNFLGGKEALETLFKNNEVIDLVESGPLVHSILELETVTINHDAVVESKNSLHNVSFSETPIDKVSNGSNSSAEKENGDTEDSGNQTVIDKNILASSSVDNINSSTITIQSCSRKLRFSRECKEDKDKLSVVGQEMTSSSSLSSEQNTNNHNTAVSKMEDGIFTGCKIGSKNSIVISNTHPKTRSSSIDEPLPVLEKVAGACEIVGIGGGKEVASSDVKARKKRPEEKEEVQVKAATNSGGDDMPCLTLCV